MEGQPPMDDVIYRRDGTVVWRHGEVAGEQVHCTHCGDPVIWLTRKQIAYGEVEYYENLWRTRSMTHCYHLLDHAGNDIGDCKS